MVATPGSVCIERQGPRPANRTVPEVTVVKQRQDMVDSHRTLKAEGFAEIVFSDSLYRLLPFLEGLSEARQAGLGLDGGDGLGDLDLVSQVFGEEILPLWRWKPGSNVAGGDRVAEVRLGQQYLTLALRTDVDGEGGVGFDVMVPCPHDDECDGYAWGARLQRHLPVPRAERRTWPTRTSSARSTARTTPTTRTTTPKAAPTSRSKPSKRSAADGPSVLPRPSAHRLGPGAVAVVPQAPRSREEMDVMPLPYFEVDVPIRSTETPGLEVVHIFTGQADSRSAAMKAAHEVYAAARAAAGRT
ncbi:hypothetical protein ACIBVL_25820 [Streptomyces sp. NPDC049687]|uniref:hypothetical protein n=1 Tax=Streptomyces sp. NPDC049687 TaxID=3365596 RepID=UPI00379DCE88